MDFSIISAISLKSLLEPQSGAHVGGAHRDFHPIHPIHPSPVPHIALDHESLAANIHERLEKNVRIATLQFINFTFQKILLQDNGKLF